MSILYNPTTKKYVNPKYTDIKPGTPGWVEVAKMGDTTPIAPPLAPTAPATPQSPEKTAPTTSPSPEKVAPTAPPIKPPGTKQPTAPPTPEKPPEKPKEREYQYISKTGELKTISALSPEEVFKKATDISEESGVMIKEEEKKFVPEPLAVKYPADETPVIELSKPSAVISPEEGKDLKLIEPATDWKTILSTTNKEIESKTKIEIAKADTERFINALKNKLVSDLSKYDEEIAKYNTPEFREAITDLQKVYLTNFSVAAERLKKQEELKFNEVTSSIKKYVGELAALNEQFENINARELADIYDAKGRGGTAAFNARKIAKIKEHYAIERANLNGRVVWLNTMLAGLREEKIDIRNMVNEYISDITTDRTIKINNLQGIINLNKPFIDSLKAEKRNDLYKLLDVMKNERDDYAKEESEKFQLMVMDPYAGIRPEDSLEEAREKIKTSKNLKKTFDLKMKTLELQLEKAKRDLEESGKNKFIVDGYDLSTIEDSVRFVKDRGQYEYDVQADKMGIDQRTRDSVLGKAGVFLTSKEEEDYKELGKLSDPIVFSKLKNAGVNNISELPVEERKNLVDEIIVAIENNLLPTLTEGQKTIYNNRKEQFIKDYIINYTIATEPSKKRGFWSRLFRPKPIEPTPVTKPSVTEPASSSFNLSEIKTPSLTDIDEWYAKQVEADYLKLFSK